MSIPLIPWAIGAVAGSAALYVFKDPENRRRALDESTRIGHQISDYVGGLFAGKEAAVTAFLEAGTGPDRERCEAMAKTGQRCRAKTNRVVAMSGEGGSMEEHGLCWRHARAVEQGEPIAIAKSDPVRH